MKGSTYHLKIQSFGIFHCNTLAVRLTHMQQLQMELSRRMDCCLGSEKDCCLDSEKECCLGSEKDCCLVSEKDCCLDSEKDPHNMV